MKVIVPVKNLIIEENFTLNEIQFIANENSLNFLEEFKIRYDYRSGLNAGIAQIFNFDIEWYEHTVIAIYEVTDFDETALLGNSEKTRVFMKNVFDILERTLDLIRIYYCRVDLLEILPMPAGLTKDGYSSLLLLNNKKQIKPLIEKITYFGIEKGIGLVLDEKIEDIVTSPLAMVICFEEVDSYVLRMIRKVIRRLNKSMYIADPNTRFIHLMTTLEVIAAPEEYIQFKETNRIISTIISTSTEEYHRNKSKLRDFSLRFREDIIHNGVDLFDDLEQKMNIDLLILQGIIVRAIEKLSLETCSTKEEFLEYIERKKVELNVGNEPKFDKSTAIENYLSKITSQKIVIEREDFSKLLQSTNIKYLQQLLAQEIDLIAGTVS